MGKGGVPKIADFGLARVLEANVIDQSSCKTDGHSRWQAPELLYRGLCRCLAEGYSKKSDIYAFASVCLEVGHSIINLVWYVELKGRVMKDFYRKSTLCRFVRSSSVDGGRFLSSTPVAPPSTNIRERSKRRYLGIDGTMLERKTLSKTRYFRHSNQVSEYLRPSGLKRFEDFLAITKPYIGLVGLCF